MIAPRIHHGESTTIPAITAIMITRIADVAVARPSQIKRLNQAIDKSAMGAVTKSAAVNFAPIAVAHRIARAVKIPRCDASDVRDTISQSAAVNISTIGISSYASDPVTMIHGNPRKSAAAHHPTIVCIRCASAGSCDLSQHLS